MVKRTRRGFVQTEEVLKKLQIGRSGGIQVCTEAKINSEMYRSASALIKAIDNLAEALTGEKGYFHLRPHGTVGPDDGN